MKNCFISLHLNETDHPHFHIVAPKSKNFGRGFYLLRKEVNNIAAKNDLVVPELCSGFEKTMLKDEKFRQEYNTFKTAGQVLSKISWTFEKARKEKDLEGFLNEKIYGNNIFYAGKYAVSFENTEHKLKSLKNKRNLYSFSQLMNEYNGFEHAGSNSLTKKILKENKELLKKVLNFELEETKSKIQEKFEKEEYKELIRDLADRISKNKKIDSAYREFWLENKDSKDEKTIFVMDCIQELYNERKIQNKKFDIQKINEIYKSFEEKLEDIEITEKISEYYDIRDWQGGEVYDDYDYDDDYYDDDDDYAEILDKFKDILSKETKNDTNVFNELRAEFRTVEISRVRGKNNVIKINGNEVDISHILADLGGKTIYQVIYNNKLTEASLEGLNEVCWGETEEKIIEIIFTSSIELLVEELDDETLKNNFNKKDFVKLKNSYIDTRNRYIDYSSTPALLDLGDVFEGLVNIVSQFVSIFFESYNFGKEIVSKIKEKVSENDDFREIKKEIEENLAAVNEIDFDFDDDDDYYYSSRNEKL